MKRLLAALTLILTLYVPAHALSNEEYSRLRRDSAFAEADRELLRVYSSAKASMTHTAFEELRESQREWLDYGRDQAARRLMRQDYSRAEAYTEATRRRTAYIRHEISSSSARPSHPSTSVSRPSAPSYGISRPSAPRPNIPSYDEADKFIGDFSKGDGGIKMSVQWYNRSAGIMEIRLTYHNDEWIGRGRLHGKDLIAESGRSSLEVRFINENTVHASMTKEFQREFRFNAEGMYKRSGRY